MEPELIVALLSLGVATLGVAIKIYVSFFRKK